MGRFMTYVWVYIGFAIHAAQAVPTYTPDRFYTHIHTLTTPPPPFPLFHHTKKNNQNPRQIEVAVFRVRALSSPKIRYKIDVNAQQTGLSGGLNLCVYMCTCQRVGAAVHHNHRPPQQVLPTKPPHSNPPPPTHKPHTPPSTPHKHRTGAVLTCRDPVFGEEGIHLVVVEGGPRAIRRCVFRGFVWLEGGRGSLIGDRWMCVRASPLISLTPQLTAGTSS